MLSLGFGCNSNPFVLAVVFSRPFGCMVLWYPFVLSGDVCFCFLCSSFQLYSSRRVACGSSALPFSKCLLFSL